MPTVPGAGVPVPMNVCEQSFSCPLHTLRSTDTGAGSKTFEKKVLGSHSWRSPPKTFLLVQISLYHGS